MIALLPTLLSCADELVLVGRHDNVLLSNTSLFLPGEHVTDASLRFRRIQLMPGSRDVQLLVPADESR